MECQTQALSDVFARFPRNAAVQEMVYKTMDHIENEAARNGRIMVSISGGSDSDIMLDLFERIGYPDGLVVYVWFDTGLEYEATKRHLRDLEAKYGVEIKRIRPKITVARAVKMYGVPFLSKEISERLGLLQKYGFPFSDQSLTYEDAVAHFLHAKSGLIWWFNQKKSVVFNIQANAALKEYITCTPPMFCISKQCCDQVKKKTSIRFEKENGVTLVVTGERRSEGGPRATKTCFTPEGKRKPHFRPLFYLTDQDKAEYKDFCGVTYSDCYEVWGFKRTGCACCPFGSQFEEELEIVKRYEPKLYAAVCKIFGPSYEYTRKYRKFKESFKREKRRHGQIDLFDNPDTILKEDAI